MRQGQRGHLAAGGRQRHLQAAGIEGFFVLRGVKHAHLHVSVLDVADVTVRRHGDGVLDATFGRLVHAQADGRNGCLCNGLVQLDAIGATLLLLVAAAHTVPAAGHGHGRFGVHHAKAILVVVVQAAPVGPALVVGVYLAGAAGQYQAHVTPGQAGVGLQHQGHHARHHRGGSGGAAEVGAVGVLQPGARGAQLRRGLLALLREIATGGAHQQVRARLAVRGALAQRVGGADAHRTHGGHARFVVGKIAERAAIARGKHIDGTPAVAPLAQPLGQQGLPGADAGVGVLEVAPVALAPAVVVDVVVLQVARQRIQHVGGGAGGQRVVAHQRGTRRHARQARAVEVACRNQPAHGRSVGLAGTAGQGQVIAVVVWTIVVAGPRHHVFHQVFVNHVQPVVHHGHAYAFTPAPAPDAVQVQILAGLRAGQRSVVVQVPLGGQQRVLAQNQRRRGGGLVEQRTFGRADRVARLHLAAQYPGGGAAQVLCQPVVPVAVTVGLEGVVHGRR